jgi:membrane protease YdiL (CAAX protease family)
VSEWTKPLKPFDVLRHLTAAALILGVIVSADPQTKFLRASSEAVPPGALRLTLTVLLIATFYFWGGLFNGRRLRFASHAPVTVTGRPKLRRAPHPAGSNALQWQLMLCGWLAFLAYPEQWTWSTVGLKTETPIVASAGAGVVVYGLLIAILTATVRLSGTEGKFLDNSMRTMAAICPRGAGQKVMAWIAFCLLNPVTEEVLFRGVLVYQTSLAIGSVWLPIALGLAVNIGNHWYQGWRPLLLHIPFYAIAVALLFSPLGLAGAIGFHFAGDIVPMSLTRRQLQQFRARHRHSAQRF